jgi:hypothetical protein
LCILGLQYAVEFVGTFIAWAFNKNLTAPFPVVHPTGIVK